MKFDMDGFSWNFIWTDLHEIWYGRICMKFGTSIFFENLSRKFKLH